MKTLIYYEDANLVKNSGVGRAGIHQRIACNHVGIEATVDIDDDSFDVVDMNTYRSKSRKDLRRFKSLGKPVVVHGHTTPQDFRDSFRIWRIIQGPYLKSVRYMYRNADLIITPTPYSLKVIKGWGIDTPIIAISNGIDVESYKDNLEAKKLFRDRFFIKEGERFVMGVGMLFPRKGLLDFIEVAKSFPDVKFIWFGDLKPLFTQLRILRAIKHRPPNVIMAGYCEGDLIKGAYQSASAMFFPSYEENEGIVVLEALASRCPILLRDIEVYRSWLKEGLNCRKANDNEGFIKELKDLLDNGEDPLVLEEGYKVALSKDLSLIGKQLKEAYESLMKK